MSALVVVEHTKRSVEHATETLFLQLQEEVFEQTCSLLTSLLSNFPGLRAFDSATPREQPIDAHASAGAGQPAVLSRVIFFLAWAMTPWATCESTVYPTAGPPH